MSDARDELWASLKVRDDVGQPERNWRWRAADWITGGLLTLYWRQNERAWRLADERHGHVGAIMRDHNILPSEARQHGRCGETMPHLLGGLATHCALPCGHGGWHRDDDGKEMGEGW